MRLHPILVAAVLLAGTSPAGALPQTPEQAYDLGLGWQPVPGHCAERR